MKYDKGLKQEKKKKSILRFCPRLPSHAPFQIGFTLLQFASGVFALIFVFLLRGHVRRLDANFEGELKNTNHPCARRALPACNAATMDRCQDNCCPEGYMCIRDPTVGLYCQDRSQTCGNFDFCLDVSDVPGTCEREECQRRKSVYAMNDIVYIAAAAGVIFDLLDLVLCVGWRDNVLWKSLFNFVACLAKWLAFGGLLGVGTQDYLSDSEGFKCFNPEGMVTLGEAFSLFQAGAAALFLSGLFSLCLVPISALHGGRLQEKPLYEMKVMDLGG